MLGYEQWLEQRRANPQDKEVLRVSKLKTIRQAEDNAQHLRQWLAERVTLHHIDKLTSVNSGMKMYQMAH